MKFDAEVRNEEAHPLLRCSDPARGFSSKFTAHFMSLSFPRYATFRSGYADLKTSPRVTSDTRKTLMRFKVFLFLDFFVFSNECKTVDIGQMTEGGNDRDQVSV